MARQIAADMGVEAELLPYDVERLIPALEAGEIDLIAAGLDDHARARAARELQQPVRRERHRARDAPRTDGRRHGRHGARQRELHDRGRRRLRRPCSSRGACGRARACRRSHPSSSGRRAARRRGPRLRRGRARADVPGARESRHHRRADGAAAAREPRGLRRQQRRSGFSGVLERVDHGARGGHLAADDDELLVQVAGLAGEARRCARR